MFYNRVIKQFKKRSAVDLLRKTAFFFSQQCYRLLVPFRHLRSLLYFRNAGVKLGSGVILNGLSYHIKAGTDVHFYDRCIVEAIGEEAALSIGSHCIFSFGVLISCSQNITIGDHVMIGEYSSVRDTSHTHKDLTKPMKGGEDLSNPVFIANDVWIGRGCIIMPGSIIEEGVVVAANSVVKGKLERFSMYGGAPAQFIKKRGSVQ